MPRTLIRWLWIIAGSISLSLGIVGIFLPLLPTTPFLLLTAACYARGSSRLHNWLLNNKLFGKYIRNYNEGKGIPARSKVLALTLLWLTIGFSILYVIPILIVQIILLTIATLVSIYIISLPTLRTTT
ncbi:YbaN family protein [[Eubacterium] cellulosolvens]